MNSSEFHFDEHTLESSALLKSWAEERRRLESPSLRPPRSEEIRSLAAQGNFSSDWGALLVAPNFTAADITGNRFIGRVVLHRESEGFGIHNSTLKDCTIGPETRIANCGIIDRYLIGAGATIENVDRLAMSGEATRFGNELELFEEELFSRRLRAVAELPFEWAAWVTSPNAALSAERKDIIRLNGAAEAHSRKYESRNGYVAAGALIRSARIIEDCWIGPHAEIEAAGSLRNSVLWGEKGEPVLIRDGANLRGAIIGPGCVVENNASIEHSIFFEHVFAGCQAMVKGSAVGPNTRLSASETNDCLLGPFTMAIHSGLILAAWWPEGKGNISYGANVGSNHTGRAPDQEIFPGEGVFFGLGCNVKYPANFRESPYTMLATGVTTLPQKVAFPFSLISSPMAHFKNVPPAYNEIQPGWGILRNAYGIERQERNMAKRLRARRMNVETAIFRPDIIERLRRAAEQLKLPRKKIRKLYTENEIAGLGKNVMTEEARREALEAYKQGARIGAAKTLFRALDRDGGKLDPKFAKWCGEILGKTKTRELLAEAIHWEERWIALCGESKSRDDRRGQDILDDYAIRHKVKTDDPLLTLMEEDRRRHRAWPKS